MSQHENTNKTSEFNERDEALALAAKLHDPEASVNPDPEDYRTASHLLSLYFTSVTPEEAGRDENFHLALDSTLSALDAMYIRDEYTHKKASSKPVGDHPADDTLMRMLQATREAQEVADRAGYGARLDSANVPGSIDELNDLNRSRIVPTGEAAIRGARFRAVTVAERATFILEKQPEVLPQLAQVGNYASLAINDMADVVARHDKDTGDVGVWNKAVQRLDIVQGDIPLYKDAVARDVSAALELAYGPSV